MLDYVRFPFDDADANARERVCCTICLTWQGWDRCVEEWVVMVVLFGSEVFTVDEYWVVKGE